MYCVLFAQCHNAVYDLVDDETLELFYAIRFIGMERNFQLLIVFNVNVFQQSQSLVVDQCCKIVGKRVKNIEKIRPYIKDCTKPGHSVIIYFGEVFGSGEVSYEKIRSRKKTVKTTGGTQSVKVATKSGRSVTVRGNANVS